VTFVFKDCTVTTWGLVGGQQSWRARWGADPDFVEFIAPRDAEVGDLYQAAREAMRAAQSSQGGENG